MNVKFHKNCAYTGKILKISCVRCSSVILDVSNSRAPMRNVFFGVTADDLLHPGAYLASSK